MVFEEIEVTVGMKKNGVQIRRQLIPLAADEFRIQRPIHWRILGWIEPPE